MRILITGGTGFLGKELIPILLNRGHSVRILSRRDVSIPGCKVVQGNFADPTDARRAVKGVDAVIHLAKLKGHNRPYQEHYRVTVKGTENMVKACLEEGMEAFVHASSIAVRLDSETPYARAKRECERIVMSARDQGMKLPVLRFGLVYDAQVLKRIKRLTWLPIPCGNQTLHLSWKKSAAEALANAVEKGKNKVYEVGDKRPVKARDFYKELARPRPAVILPRVFSFPLVLAGYPARIMWNAVGKNPPLTPEFARYLFKDRILETKEGLKDLGYKQVDTLEKVREWKDQKS